MWRLTNQLHETAVEVEGFKVGSFRTSSKSSAASDKDDGKGLGLEDGQQSPIGENRHFEDFDYNKERAQKASQVILSINQDAEDADDDEANYMVTDNGNAGYSTANY